MKTCEYVEAECVASSFTLLLYDLFMQEHEKKAQAGYYFQQSPK